MRRRRFQSHTVDLLFTLSLFCVFAVCAFLVITMGVRVYRSTAQYLEDTYSARTALSYVAEKIRQHDAEGQVALTQLEGRNAILLTDEIEGSLYETYLYLRAGSPAGHGGLSLHGPAGSARGWIFH